MLVSKLNQCSSMYAQLYTVEKRILASLQELPEVSGKKAGRPKAVDKYREQMVWSQIVHSEWVSKVLYLAELESAVSCSLDGLLWLMDVERRSVHFQALLLHLTS
jgi:hypothetical protein